MKPNTGFCFALILSSLVVDRSPAQSLAQQFERLAQTSTHFSLTVIVHNRALRIEPDTEEMMFPTNGPAIRRVAATNGLAAEQLRLRSELHALSGDRAGLSALLTNSDPKVRTLALGAIFQREDGRDLPLIASLLTDTAKTFPDLHDSIGSMGGPRPVSEYENPQTIGLVADEMLAFWGVPQTGEPLPTDSGQITARLAITTNDFAGYWKKYAGRDYSASWFAAKMKRATRQTTPIQTEYQPDIQRVLHEMEKLPIPDRIWIQLYVLAPERGWVESEPDDYVLASAQLVALAKKLGPDDLLKFLQRRKISDDPDLLMDQDNPEFVEISNFILLHSDRLLRPKDADALLTAGYTQHDSGTINPAWAIGAALVQPARASEILRAAIAAELKRSEMGKSYVRDTGMLAGYLWRIRGTAEKDFLVDWFYASLFAKSSPYPQPCEFMWEVRAATRSDTKKLLTALISHPRFELTDWELLMELLKTVNATRAQPLLSERDIYAVQPGSEPNQKAVLDRWRHLLRHEFGIAETTTPIPPMEPKRIITEPTYSIALTNAATYITLTPDGRFLAVLNDGNEGGIEICEAGTGNHWWEIPASRLSRMAFRDSEHLLILDTPLSDWDVAQRAKVSETKLTGGPYSGVWNAAPVFNRATGRLAFAGYQSLSCFDTATGRALWTIAEETGVGGLSAFSADGRFLAAGGGSDSERIANLFDAATGKLLRRFDEHSGRIGALAFSPDSHSLLTATSENGARLWDVATGKLQREFSYPIEFARGGAAWTPAFSPDGRWLAIVGAYTKSDIFRIGVFNTETGELQWEIRQSGNDWSKGPPVGLAFSPDGRTLYSCGRQLAAWSLATK